MKTSCRALDPVEVGSHERADRGAERAQPVNLGRARDVDATDGDQRYVRALRPLGRARQAGESDHRLRIELGSGLEHGPEGDVCGTLGERTIELLQIVSGDADAE